MKYYCLKCKKDIEKINPRVSINRNGRTMIWSKCAICGSKKSRFITNQEAKELLSNLGITTPLSKVPLLSDILFWVQLRERYKWMNKIVNKFLLAGYKFMPEMHLKQPGFTFIACVLLTKNKERIKKIKRTGDTNYIYKNELDKACFQHGMAYVDFKVLAKRTAFDKVLKDKVFNIAKSPKYYGYKRGIASMVYKFFDKKTAGGGINMNANNDKLAEELHKPIIRKNFF